MCYCNQVGFAQPSLLPCANTHLPVKSGTLSSDDVGRAERAGEW